jgi:WD40 repeat protein
MARSGRGAVSAPGLGGTGRERSHRGSYSGVTDVVFSPEGQVLAGGGQGGTVPIWQASLFTHAYSVLRAEVGLPTKAKWAQYASGEPEPKSCA